MDHAALDGAGPHDRHLDDEVVVLPGFQTRQHRHLRPALDLEHADRIGLAQHVVDGGVRGIHAERRPLAIVLLDQVEALAQAGQHAEAQHVDLVDLQGVEVVLVPFDDGTVVHGRILDRHQLVEPALGEDEAADMLRKMARKAAQRRRQFERQRQPRIGRIEAGLAHVVDIDAARPHAPHRVGHHAHRVGREAERLADFADGAAAPVGDHRGRQRGARAAFLAVDPLDHVLAPLMLEIDIDVGRLVALVGKKALEQDPGFVGIDRSDAEAIAHGGIGGRAAALAKDAQLARLPDDFVHGQEVGRDLLLIDQREFVPDRLGNVGRNAVGIAPRRAFPGEAHELVLWSLAAFVLDRVLVGELIEREMAASRDLLRALDGARMAMEQPRHLLRLLEMALGTGEAAEAQSVDGAAQTNGRHHVVQRPPLGHVIVHVVGGDQSDTHLGGEIVEQRQAARIVATEQHGAGEIAAVAEQAGECQQALAEGRLLGPAWRQDDGQDAFGMGREVVEGEVALPLRRPAVADRQQAGEPFVGFEIGGIGEQRIAVARLEAGADQQLESLFVRDRKFFVVFLDRRIGPHHAGQGVAVGDADGGVAEADRLQRQLARVRAAAQEAVVGRDLQLGVHSLTRRRARGCAPAARRGWRCPRTAAPAGRSRQC